MNKIKLPIILAIIAVVGIVAIVATISSLDASISDRPDVSDPEGCVVHVGGNADCQHKAKCAICGEEYGELGQHIEVALVGKLPTCTESGLTSGSKCSVCGTTLEAQTTISAKGHNIIVSAQVEPDCYNDGYTKHEACTDCDYTNGKVVLPASHTFDIEVPELPATCDEDGCTAYTICSVCGETNGKEIIPAGHRFSEADANGTRVCSSCGLTEVSTSEGLKAAIEAGTKNIVVLAGNYVTNVKVPGGSNITIVGAGESTVLEGQIATTSSTEGTLTLRDLVINVNDNIADSTGISQTGKSAIALWGTQTVICENVTFNMSLKNSTAITSWWDTGVGTSIVVRNCVFNANGQRPIRATGNLTVENTTFNDPYRYAVQLTAKTSTATLMDKAIINFTGNTIVNGENGKAFVYGIQLEGEEYGCNDLIINGADNTIVGGEWDTANESAMYFCECCPKVDHDSIEWNVETEVVHEGHTWKTDANGNKVCSSCGVIEITSPDNVKDVFADLEDGDTVILPAGTYTLPSTIAGKDIIIEGVGDDTVIDFTRAYNIGDASLTFKNLKLQSKNANVMNNLGLQHTTGDIVYENCTFDGAVVSEHNGTVTYIGCTFTGTGYITTYAVDAATFIGCTFDKADSRAILVYSHGDNPCVVTVDNCTFAAAEQGKTGAGAWTAAIEIDTTNIPSLGTEVHISNTTVDEMYSGLYRDKSAAGKANAVVYLDGGVAPEYAQRYIENAVSGDVIYLAAGRYDSLVIRNASGSANNDITVIGNDGVVVGHLDLNGSKNVVIKNIEFDASLAVLKGNFYRNISFYNAKSKANAVGAVIKNCRFVGAPVDAGNYVPVCAETKSTGARVADLTVANCEFTAPSLYCIYLNYAAKGTVSLLNNTFDNFYAYGISMPSSQSNLTAKGNTFIYSERAHLTQSVAIMSFSRAGTHMITAEITGNTFTSIPGVEGLDPSLVVFNKNYTKDNLSVAMSGNTFSGVFVVDNEDSDRMVYPR